MPSSWEESALSCCAEAVSPQVLGTNIGGGLPGLLGGDASLVLALFSIIESQIIES